MAKRVMAYVPGSVWGTEVAVGANRGILFETEELPVSAPTPMLLRGPDMTWETVVDTGSEEQNTGRTIHPIRYEGLGDIYAHVIGSDVVTQEDVVNSASAYLHTMTLNESIDGKFGTLALDKGSTHHDITVWQSIKCAGFELTFRSMNEPIICSLDWLFDHTLPSGDSAINTSTQISAVTYRTLALPIKPLQLAFRANDQSAAALASGDQVKLESMTIGFRRSLEFQYVTSDGTSAAANRTQEPLEANEGFPELVLTVGMKRQTAESLKFLDNLQAQTAMKGDFTFTSGKDIGSGDTTPLKYRLLMQFPHLIVLPGFADQIVQKNLNVVEVPFKVMAPTTAPSGMTGVVEPFRALFRDSISAAHG